jgi:addiction module RelE/StbE family toxin
VRVVWTETALRGVWRAYDYLMDFNPRAAAHLAESLLAAGDSLENFPHRGRPVRGTSLRELVTVSPYIIRYRVAGDTVIILRVRHTARRVSVHGRGGDLDRHAVRRGGVGGGGHRTVGLRWSCKTSTMAERGIR